MFVVLKKSRKTLNKLPNWVLSNFTMVTKALLPPGRIFAFFMRYDSYTGQSILTVEGAQKFTVL